MGVTINNESTTTEPPPYREQTAAKATGEFNTYFWYQIFALDSVVVKTQKWFSPHGAS